MDVLPGALYLIKEYSRLFPKRGYRLRKDVSWAGEMTQQGTHGQWWRERQNTKVTYQTNLKPRQNRATRAATAYVPHLLAGRLSATTFRRPVTCFFFRGLRLAMSRSLQQSVTLGNRFLEIV